MCKVYSKEEYRIMELGLKNSVIETQKKSIIVKNKNHNTCTGTAFIKP